MSEGKQRSLLFKLFRAILKIIMLPITWALYVVKHPLLIAVVLLVIALGLAYYPMSKGVKLADVPSWYMGKSKEISADVVNAVAESEGIVPEALKQEAKKVQKTIEEEKAEEKRIKSENDQCALVAADDFVIPYNGGRHDINLSLNLPDKIDMPLNKDEKIGFIDIISDGRKVGEVDIIARDDFVPEEKNDIKTCFGFIFRNLIRNIL